MTFEKLNLEWNFTDEKWSDKYIIGNTNIYDAAVLWEKNSYIPSTMMCISFQLKKHLSLGKGGIILLDNARVTLGRSTNSIIRLSLSNDI
jgi:hypothetical protein